MICISNYTNTFPRLRFSLLERFTDNLSLYMKFGNKVILEYNKIYN
jgi:hypothetical protein